MVVAMTAAEECSKVNSRKENQMLSQISHQKVHFVLSRINLAALNIAINAMKACFGDDLIFLYANLNKKAGERLEYTVHVSARLSGWVTPNTCNAVVTFTLTEKSGQAKGYEVLVAEEISVILCGTDPELLRIKGDKTLCLKRTFIDTYVPDEKSAALIKRLFDSIHVYAGW
jgi:hypothetical protein